jgi:hypothetical protein
MEISKLKSYIRSIYGRVSISVWAPVQFNHAHWFDSEVDEKSFWLRLPYRLRLFVLKIPPELQILD